MTPPVFFLISFVILVSCLPYYVGKNISSGYSEVPLLLSPDLRQLKTLISYERVVSFLKLSYFLFHKCIESSLPDVDSVIT